MSPEQSGPTSATKGLARPLRPTNNGPDTRSAHFDYPLHVEPAVFLDRDNTLIANDGDLGDPAAVQLLEGVAEGLAALREAGFRLIVITNQGGVARGAYDESQVDAVHQEIAAQVDLESGRTGVIDRFYYCPYHPEGTVAAYRRDHPWRKPRPGMILQAARDMRLDLARSWVVGDQARDIQAGRAANCHTVLVGTTEEQSEQARPSAVVTTFREAVSLILRESTGRAAGNSASSESSNHDLQREIGHLKQVMADLSEELRMERGRRAAFTPLKLASVVFQLVAVLLLLLGLMHIGQPQTFFTWAICAVFVQLLTIAILQADGRS